MPFDAFPSTTTPRIELSPLAVVTVCGALAAYDRACRYGGADDYQIAAHMMARVIKTHAHHAAPEATPAEPKRTRAAKAEKTAFPDLSTPLSIPKARRTYGRFYCLWTDGSVTRVSAVPYDARKPETAAACAFQVADRLRRSRHAKAYDREMDPDPYHSIALDRWVRGSLDMRADSPTYRELVSVLPMPALASVHDEDGETVFSAPEGSSDGAGDPHRAAELEAKVYGPRGIPLPIPAMELAYMRLAAERMWIVPEAEWAPAAVGESCRGVEPYDLDGQTVVLNADALEAHKADLDALYELALEKGGAKSGRATRLAQLRQTTTYTLQKLADLAANGRPLTVRCLQGGNSLRLIAGKRSLDVDALRIPVLARAA